MTETENGAAGADTCFASSVLPLTSAVPTAAAGPSVEAGCSECAGRRGGSGTSTVRSAPASSSGWTILEWLWIALASKQFMCLQVNTTD